MAASRRLDAVDSPSRPTAHSAVATPRLPLGPARRRASPRSSVSSAPAPTVRAGPRFSRTEDRGPRRSAAQRKDRGYNHPGAPMQHISSRQNPIVKRFRDLARGDGEGRWMLLDGEHLVGEALAAGIAIDVAAFTGSASSDRFADLVAALERAGAATVTVTDQVLDAMSPVRQPSGIVAIAARPASTLDAVLKGSHPLVLILDAVQDPGNVGAIVRAAEGCGATGLVATDGTADPFGWKALRGGMGSTFRLPIATKCPLDAAIRLARIAGLRVLAATAHGETPLPLCDLTRGCVVLLGGEGAGLTPAIAAAADERLAIPMRPPVESLNVAVSAALVLYEAGRQRAQTAQAARSPHVAL